MPMFTYRCGKRHTTDHLHRASEYRDGAWVDVTRPDTIPCERCGEPAAYAPSAPAFRLKKGRHFDPATNRVFASEDAAKRYYRSRGISEEPASHHADFLARQEAAVAAEHERGEAEYQDYMKRLAEAPEYAGHRELQDKGYYHDVAKDHLAKQGVSVSTDNIEIAVGG